MSITNVVLEYRRKINSLSPESKRIWDLANRMMNEMMRSENADLQHCYSSSRRHGDASRKAQDELLEILSAPGVVPVPGEPDGDKIAREICEALAATKSNVHWMELVRGILRASYPQKGQGWVSVEERLPDWRGNVLVLTQHGVSIGWRDFCDPPNWTLLYDPHTRTERTLDEAIANGSKITHWQPLPAPPSVPAGPQEEKKK